MDGMGWYRSRCGPRREASTGRRPNEGRLDDGTGDADEVCGALHIAPHIATGIPTPAMRCGLLLGAGSASIAPAAMPGDEKAGEKASSSRVDDSQSRHLLREDGREQARARPEKEGTWCGRRLCSGGHWPGTRPTPVRLWAANLSSPGHGPITPAAVHAR